MHAPSYTPRRPGQRAPAPQEHVEVDRENMHPTKVVASLGPTFSAILVRGEPPYEMNPKNHEKYDFAKAFML